MFQTYVASVLFDTNYLIELSSKVSPSGLT